MKNTAMRLLTCLLTLSLLFSCAVAETAVDLDYTVEEKLVKQLQAGSGFTGTLTLESTANTGRESDALTTIKPLTVDMTYIYTREDTATQTPAENRLTFALTDSEKTLATAELSLSSGLAALQSSLLGDGWYILRQGAAQADTADGQTSVMSALGTEATAMLDQSALPGIATFMAGALGTSLDAGNFSWEELLDPYATKIDLWLESYRQAPILGKTDDGTTTMVIDYSIPASALKAQLKQMVLDLLGDDELLEVLAQILPDEDVQLYLNPEQQNYYFFAIDELPLNGEVTLSRTVSLMGDTLGLTLSLPFYDSEGGAATLTYQRIPGEGDLPQTNTIELAGETRHIRIAYQVYDTFTGTKVYQGTVLREPTGAEAFSVSEDETANTARTFSAAFTVSSVLTTGTDELGKDFLQRNIELTLAPEYTPENTDDDAQTPTAEQQASYVVFTPFTATLQTICSSGQAKNASTALDLSLVLSGEEQPQTVTITFSGKTTSMWTPQAVDTDTAQSLADMDVADFEAMLGQAAVRGGLILLPYIGLPSVQTSDAPDTAEATPTPENTNDQADATVTPEASTQP